MQREDEKNKKRKVEEESYEAQEKRPNIQRERERGGERRRQWELGLPWRNQRSTRASLEWIPIFHFHHSHLSLSLSPLLSPSICISSLSMQAPPPPSPLWFPRKVALFYYILQQNEDGSNPNPCLLFLSVYIPFLFLL